MRVQKNFRLYYCINILPNVKVCDLTMQAKYKVNTSDKVYSSVNIAATIHIIQGIIIKSMMLKSRCKNHEQIHLKKKKEQDLMCQTQKFSVSCVCDKSKQTPWTSMKNLTYNCVYHFTKPPLGGKGRDTEARLPLGSPPCPPHVPTNLFFFLMTRAGHGGGNTYCIDHHLRFLVEQLMWYTNCFVA